MTSPGSLTGDPKAAQSARLVSVLDPCSFLALQKLSSVWYQPKRTLRCVGKFSCNTPRLGSPKSSSPILRLLCSGGLVKAKDSKDGRSYRAIWRISLLFYPVQPLKLSISLVSMPWSMKEDGSGTCREGLTQTQHWSACVRKHLKCVKRCHKRALRS